LAGRRPEMFQSLDCSAGGPANWHAMARLPSVVLLEQRLEKPLEEPSQAME
jgi:hypothetical protein